MICKKIYDNHNNATAHSTKCLAQKAKNSQSLTLEAFGITNNNNSAKDIGADIENYQSDFYEEIISPENEASIWLIAVCNIPYTQMEKPTWHDFIKKSIICNT